MFYQETLFIGTPVDTYEALETGISLSTGAPLGNLEGGSFTGDSEIQMESSGNGAYISLSIGALQGEP
jgi:hypothetical protein